MKKQADIVDEQIDATGRAFLGLTLACARCHDHKFDPVTQHDYYALAGIFHSSNIEMQRELRFPQDEHLMSVWEQEQKHLEEQLTAAQAEYERSIKGAITWEAEDFVRGNVSAIDSGYGEGIGIISDPGGLHCH